MRPDLFVMHKLEKVDDMLNLIFFSFLTSRRQAFLETLTEKKHLPQRSGALASLKETGIPEAVELLGLF